MAEDYPVEELSEGELKQLADLAKDFKEQKAVIDIKVAELKELSKKFAELERILIPNAMERIGIKSFELMEGGMLMVKEEMSAGLTGKYRDPAIKWLVENGHDDLISHDVVCKFGKGEENRVEKLLALIQKNLVKPNVAAIKSINTNTFKALCRELKEEGKITSEELFEIGVSTYNVTKIN